MTILFVNVCTDIP
uniref:Uncharacterized protein n=1 Tax=Anguilla anguilla TaxID=7936 RepID=A0A0E9XZD1_ANGAN